MSGTIDISEKQPTARRAVARSVLRAPREVIDSVRCNKLKKNDPLPTARAAAMLAAKQTPQILPHCHPIAVTDIKVDFALENDSVSITCTVSALDRTGVEMEALTGASVAALTLYDMIKATCVEARIEDSRLLEKSGGRSGHWKAREDSDDA